MYTETCMRRSIYRIITMTKNKNQSTININIEGKRNTKEALFHAVIAYAAFLGIGYFIYNVFSLEAFDLPLLLIMVCGLVACVGISILMDFVGVWRYGILIPLGCVLVFGVGALAAGNSFKDGIFSYMNQILRKEIAISGKVHLLYETGTNPRTGVIVVSLILVILLALLINVICRKNVPGCLLLLFISLLVIVTYLKGYDTGDFGYGAIAAAILLLMYSHVKNIVDNQVSVRHRIPGLIILIIAAGLILAGIYYSGIQQYADMSGMYADFQKKDHVSRYETHENPMPEGMLDQLKAFGGNGRTALQINMSNPEPMYFKGYTGEVFDGKKWGKLDGTSTVASSDLFYWLHEKGFYGQSQAGDLYAKDYKGKTGTIDVINKDACARYIYTPYSLNQTKEKIADQTLIGDRNIESEEGIRSYRFSCTNKALYKSFVLQNKIGKLKDDAYLDAEESYRKYIYENDLNLGKDEETLMKQLLGDKKELTLAEAQVIILNYLNENVKYSKKATENGDEPVMSYFLKVSKSGYAPLYATAATLMMRYYGIPARYAEGYILPKEKTEIMAAGENFALTQNYAHAWCEIYLDGIGWIPFETVPKYLNPELYEPTENTQKFGDGGTVNVDNNSNDDLQDDEDDDEEEEKQENIIKRIGKVIVAIPWYVYVGVASFILLVILILLILRHSRRKRFLESFDGEDRRLAVINAFTYAAYLLSHMDIRVDPTFPAESAVSIETSMDRDMMEAYSESLALNGKARFSAHEITEEEQAIVKDFAFTLLDIYKKSRNLPARFADKWIRCVY